MTTITNQGLIVRARRITGTTLQRIRLRLFKQQPLCVNCLVKQPCITRLATQRDHIKPLHKGGPDEESNTQPLCEECHLEKSKTERGQQYKPKRRIGVDGYPIEGVRGEGKL